MLLILLVKSADFSFLSTGKRWKYFRDTSNHFDWISAILSLLFVIPIMLNAGNSLNWQAGAMAVLFSWIGLLLYLQRCSALT